MDQAKTRLTPPPFFSLLCASETSSKSNGTVFTAVSQFPISRLTFSQLMLWLRITQLVRHLSTRKHAQHCQLQHINNI